MEGGSLLCASKLLELGVLGLADGRGARVLPFGETMGSRKCPTVGSVESSEGWWKILTEGDGKGHGTRTSCQ